MNSNKSIASLKKGISTGANIGTKNFIIPAIDILVASHPEFIPAWILAKGFYGSLFDAKQDEINEFVSFIANNSSVFVEEIVNTKDFRDGFIVVFEEYIKQRNEEKRKIIQSIFLGFTLSDDKKNFELERFFDLLNKISSFQFVLIKNIKLEKQRVINSNEQDAMEFEYPNLKYLEYLGILHCEKESTIESTISDITENGDGDVDSELFEKQIFYLSELGNNFIVFIAN